MKNTNQLSQIEIKVILRAADEIIARGGRTLLAKILKGSKEKKVLQLGLNSCPVYGYFESEKLDEIIQKIDWLIDYDFLDIEYNGKLPMIIFTERGWRIESDQYTDELLNEWQEWLKDGKQNPDMTYLKDRNREMILLFLQKIKELGDQAFIPYLRLWEKVDYKKVRVEIRKTIDALENKKPIYDHDLLERKEALNEAIKGSEPHDVLIKCWECGKRFTFTIAEQQFYKQKGFTFPKRCKKCRNQRDDIFI